MNDRKRGCYRWPGGWVAVVAMLWFTGCQSDKAPPSIKVASGASPPIDAKAPPAAVVPQPAAATPAATAPLARAVQPVRIKAGPAASFKDAEGNLWLPDQGFADGETIERPDLPIANTKSPAIYRSERYSMTSFTYPVPNGNYIVKLHFAETFEGITGPGERVFSFNVQGQEFKDFDVWAKTGGAQRAYIETVKVKVTDSKLSISFTPKVENPEINGIEILPDS